MAERLDDEAGTETIALPHLPSDPVVWASTFNRLRQRSDLASAVP